MNAFVKLPLSRNVTHLDTEIFYSSSRVANPHQHDKWVLSGTGNINVGVDVPERQIIVLASLSRSTVCQNIYEHSSCHAKSDCFEG